MTERETPPNITIDLMWDCLKNNPSILPVKISSIAPLMGMTNDECCKAFIEHATAKRGPVTFRFPPLPCAAILAVGT